jgi:hypothetical protein
MIEDLVGIVKIKIQNCEVLDWIVILIRSFIFQ